MSCTSYQFLPLSLHTACSLLHTHLQSDHPLNSGKQWQSGDRSQKWPYESLQNECFPGGGGRVLGKEGDVLVVVLLAKNQKKLVTGERGQEMSGCFLAFPQWMVAFCQSTQNTPCQPTKCWNESFTGLHKIPQSEHVFARHLKSTNQQRKTQQWTRSVTQIFLPWLFRSLWFKVVMHFHAWCVSDSSWNDAGRRENLRK